MENSLSLPVTIETRLILSPPSLSGFPMSTVSIWFITYCGVQLIKERERLQAIEEEKADKEKTE